jgi:hypothetical protein
VRWSDLDCHTHRCSNAGQVKGPWSFFVALANCLTDSHGRLHR